MAMKGLDAEEFSAPMAEINTTPLVDVMLVLLVIFLVTAPMLTQTIPLQLPKEIASETTDKNPLSLSITKEGAYYWEKTQISEAELEQRLQQQAAQNPERPIHLRADGDAPYRHISRLLALATQQGLHKIGFVSDTQQTE